MTLREKIEVMEAFERGEEIEVSYINKEKWSDISNPDWSWGAYNYRIKQPKQTVTIEKWLTLGTESEYRIFEVDNIKVMERNGWIKVKLLETYEVEL